jgi:hypothetical protein
LLKRCSGKKSLWAVAVFFFIFTLVFFKGTSLAASNITISPASSSLYLKPGSTNKEQFQVINSGTVGYNYEDYAAPYSVKGVNYTPDFFPIPNAPNVVSWFSFTTKTSLINPSQLVNLSYTVTVPKNTPAGGYYAAIFAQTKPTQSTNNVQIISRVGELIYIQVAGPVTEKGSTQNWQVALLQKNPLDAQIEIENSGSIFFQAAVNIKVEDILGSTKYSLTTQKYILPQTIRRITASWTSAPFLGLFKVKGSVTYLGKTSQLPTKYVLVISPLTRLIVLLIIVLVIIILLFRKFHRKKHAKHLKT